MAFERRKHTPGSLPHECPLPRLRYVLFWPRWREGARWRCGTWRADTISGNRKHQVVTVGHGYSGGCGALWEFQREEGTYDPYLKWEQIEPEWSQKAWEDSVLAQVDAMEKPPV